METFYKAYSKQVDDQLTYFVKRYLHFPEYNGVADILEGYGMHTDFEKACSIAGIESPKIRKQIFEEMLASAPQAKVIDLNPVDSNVQIKMVH